MAEKKDPPRQPLVQQPPRQLAQDQKRSFTLTARTSGLLAYYAQTRRLTESMVVEQALRVLLRGMRVSDPGDNAGQDSEAA